MNPSVRAVMNDDVPAALIAYPTASRGTIETPPSARVPKDPVQVCPPRLVSQVQVDLGTRERRPHQPPPLPQRQGRERQAWAWAVDPHQLGLVRTTGVHVGHGQEHSRVWRGVAAGEHVAELAESAETWLTMRSTITAYSPARSRASSHDPSRGSTSAWSTGSKPASAPSNGVKNSSTCTPAKSRSNGPSILCNPVRLPPNRSEYAISCTFSRGSASPMPTTPLFGPLSQ